MTLREGRYQLQYRPLFDADEAARVELVVAPTERANRSRALSYLVSAGLGTGAGVGAAALLGQVGAAKALAGLAGGLLGAGGAHAMLRGKDLPLQTRVTAPDISREEAEALARMAGFPGLPEGLSRRPSFQLAYGYDPGEPVVTKVSVALICARRPGGFLDRLRAHSASLRAY